MRIELRSVAGPDAVDVSDNGVIYGLAIPYDRVTTIGDMTCGGFREKISPGACTKSLRDGDIVALFNHESSMPLGRTSAGNLKLNNTKRGVEPELTPVQTSYAQDLAELVRSKVIKGWSFGFEVLKDTWTDSEGRDSDEWSGTDRNIREMRLIEVSPVTFPAYGGDMTNIGMRSELLAERETRSGNPSRDDSIGRSGDGAVPAFMGVFDALSPESLDALPEELRKAVEDLRAGNPKKPYGNVKYADPKNGKYPIDTKAHVKAAWAYINMPKNQKFYPLNGVSLSSVMAKIKAAALSYGIDISEANEADLAMEWRMYVEDYTVNSPETEARETAERETRKAAKKNAKKAKRAAKKAAKVAAGDAYRVQRVRELADGNYKLPKE